MILEDLFFAPSFFTPSTHFLQTCQPTIFYEPVNPYFCPSIFVFTRPNDGWTSLYIKLWLCITIISSSKCLPPITQVLASDNMLGTHMVHESIPECAWCNVQHFCQPNACDNIFIIFMSSFILVDACITMNQWPPTPLVDVCRIYCTHSHGFKKGTKFASHNFLRHFYICI